MRNITAIARIVLGLIFLVLGLNGFLHFLPAPPPMGLAGTFFGVLISSHYYIVIFGIQVIAGILLLANQYVPLALALLAPVIVNILVFHITMLPSGLPLPLFVTIVWIVVALPMWPRYFAPLLRNAHSP